MARNLYKVPKKMWDKFGAVGQRTFNELYRSMQNQNFFAAPTADRLPKKHWDVLRWNTACVAAIQAADAQAG